MASTVFSLVGSSSVISLVSPASIRFDKRLKLSSKTSHGYGLRGTSTQRYNLSLRAMDSSGPAPGSIDSTLMTSMTEKIKEKLNTNDVIVNDAYGDGRHVSIEVISSEFEGKSSVNRQRMVYQAIWEELQTTVHAVDSMRTWTPQEAAEEKSKESA